MYLGGEGTHAASSPSRSLPRKRGPHRAGSVLRRGRLPPATGDPHTENHFHDSRNFTSSAALGVKQGQLLARLENGDLAGAAEKEQGRIRTGGSKLRHNNRRQPPAADSEKLSSMPMPQNWRLMRSKKVYDARKQLYEQGALPRPRFRHLRPSRARPGAQPPTSRRKKQLADLQRIGKQQTLKSAGGQLFCCRGKLF